MKRTLTMLAALVLTLSLVLGAVPALAEEPVKLVLWTWGSTEGEDNPCNYYQKLTNGKVEFEQVVVSADDYLTKLQQALASGGDMPDILMGEATARASLLALGIWENLEAAPYNLNREELYPSVYGVTADKEGNIVSVENAINPGFIGYKRSLAKEYLGTDDPDALEQMFQTYDDYIRIGQEVYAKSEGKVVLFNGLQDIVRMMDAQSKTQSKFDANGNLDLEHLYRPVVETLAKFRDANAAGNRGYWSSQWSTAYDEDVCIFQVCAPWSIRFNIVPNDVDGEGNWGAFKAIPGGSFTLGGTSYGINKHSSEEKKQAAWEFISWYLLSKEGSQFVLEKEQNFLPVKAFYNDDSYVDGTHPWFGEQKIYRLFERLIDDPVLAQTEYTVYDNIIQNALYMVSELLLADSSVGAEEAYELFIEDVAANVYDVEVIR